MRTFNALSCLGSYQHFSVCLKSIRLLVLKIQFNMSHLTLLEILKSSEYELEEAEEDYEDANSSVNDQEQQTGIEEGSEEGSEEDILVCSKDLTAVSHADINSQLITNQLDLVVMVQISASRTHRD